MKRANKKALNLVGGRGNNGHSCCKVKINAGIISCHQYFKVYYTISIIIIGELLF